MFGKTLETQKLAYYLGLDDYYKSLIENFNINEKEESKSYDILIGLINRSLIARPRLFYCFREFDSSFIIPRSYPGDDLDIKKNFLNSLKMDRRFLPATTRIKINYSLWILDLPEDVKHPRGEFDSFSLIAGLLELENKNEIGLISAKVEAISGDTITFELEVDLAHQIYTERNEPRFYKETGELYFDGRRVVYTKGTYSYALLSILEEWRGMKLKPDTVAEYTKSFLGDDKSFNNWEQVKDVFNKLRKDFSWKKGNYFPVEFRNGKNNKYIIFMGK